MNGSDTRQTGPTSVFEDGREAQPLAVAQRGDSRHHVGNTLAALSAAVAAGVDAIKVDVRFTRDEVPVLVSERDLIHSLGKSVAIDELELNQLRQLEDEIHGSAMELDRRIPALHDVLVRLHGSVSLVLEVMSDRSAPGICDYRERALRRVIGDESKVTVVSADPWVLRRLRWHDEGVAIGIHLDAELLPNARDLARELTSSMMIVTGSAIDRDTVVELQNEGQRVLIYAPDEEAIAATLTLAPDGVVADDPFVLVQAIGKRPLGSRAA